MQFTFLISAILIPVVLSFLFSFLRRSILKKEKEMSPDSFVLRPGILILIVGIIGCVFGIGCITLMYTFPNETSSIWVALIFGFCTLLSIYLIVIYFTYRVFFNEEDIVKRGFFKIKIINYKDIKFTKLVGNNNSMQYTLCLYNSENKKLLYFDNTYTGFDLAIEKLKNLKIEIKEKPYNTFWDNQGRI